MAFTACQESQNRSTYPLVSSDTTASEVDTPQVIQVLEPTSTIMTFEDTDAYYQVVTNWCMDLDRSYTPDERMALYTTGQYTIEIGTAVANSTQSSSQKAALEKLESIIRNRVPFEEQHPSVIKYVKGTVEKNEVQLYFKPQLERALELWKSDT